MSAGVRAMQRAQASLVRRMLDAHQRAFRIMYRDGHDAAQADMAFYDALVCALRDVRQAVAAVGGRVMAADTLARALESRRRRAHAQAMADLCCADRGRSYGVA